MSPLRRFGIPLLAGLLVPVVLQAQPLTQEEALALAFSEADSVVRRTAYLDESQLTQVSDVAGPGAEAPSGIIPFYVAFLQGRPIGVAYFDAHRVRTLDEVLMVVVGPDHRVSRVETVAFREPPEYEAPGGWLDLFEGRRLEPALSLKGDIPNITGATLTAGSVTLAVRRVLAIHQVLDPFENSGPGSS